jgi:hypothetical protein
MLEFLGDPLAGTSSIGPVHFGQDNQTRRSLHQGPVEEKGTGWVQGPSATLVS